MNARELASMLGVSEATVSRIGTGDRRPSVDLMLKIKDELGWTLDQQARALGDGTYPAEFRDRMERREAPGLTHR